MGVYRTDSNMLVELQVKYPSLLLFTVVLQAADMECAMQCKRSKQFDLWLAG